MTHTFAIISAELAGLTVAQNALRSEQLRERLSYTWMGTFPVSGCYKGTRERACLVPLLHTGRVSRQLLPDSISEQLRRLRTIGAFYGQESILYVAPDYSAHLHYCDGARVEPLGRWVETDRATAEARDSFTTYTSGITCGARYFVTDAPT